MPGLVLEEVYEKINMSSWFSMLFELGILD